MSKCITGTEGLNEPLDTHGSTPISYLSEQEFKKALKIAREWKTTKKSKSDAYIPPKKLKAYNI